MPTVVMNEQEYQRQLDEKVELTRQQFQPFAPPSLELFRSDARHFRMRAEFRIWHDDKRSFYRMFDPASGQPYTVTEFPIGSQRINELMTPLMERIERNELLRTRLFQVNFLTTLTGGALITLIYHKPIDEKWDDCARTLQQELDIQVIGRSKKQRRVLERDYLIESLNVDGRTYHYQQAEGGFTQPNATVNTKMLGWASDVSRGIDGDLLELYCGNGNFTNVLAHSFNRVLATEVSKTSVHHAQKNFNLNGVSNVHIARLSSAEIGQAIRRERAFRRLESINLDDYSFSTLLVDPPRAGLDPETESLSIQFDNIIYISCNPRTLSNNLKFITQTHSISRFALFDQFPYTHHREMGVHLVKR